MNGIYSEDASFSSLRQFIAAASPTSVHVLVDEHTVQHCYPLIRHLLSAAGLIQIPAGELHKNLATCEIIWQQLTEAEADRKALLLNVGGGMISDMGGFAAACFKRGIRFIHIPTTLLAMVDASAGAKCGIDFMGYKNLLGLFQDPEAVFVYPGFLRTLPVRELRSGYAEVLKHYLIADAAAFEQAAKIPTLLSLSPPDWQVVIERSIRIKQHLVELDPYEQGVRKALNFGHTIGHALESHFLPKGEQRLLHGEAVAIGLIAESFISARLNLISEDELAQITDTVLRHFTMPAIPEAELGHILALIRQDKKNEGTQARFTLLQGIGHFTINRAVEKELMLESLIYVNSLRA